MDIGALLLGVISLVLALLDQRKRTAPARVRAQQDEAVDDDLKAMDRAIADLDAASIGARFERERRETLKRVPPQSGPADSWLP
ncbi:MAG: hypothetical protein H8K10_15530 [Nitrospira sp.]|nr:hypothetical protein [Nitrospira sp.]